MEMFLSSITILYFCGPFYFFNLLISFYFYGKVTKRLAMDRKIYI